MKLNNLSRLTALLMAVMMLGMASAGADSSVDLGDVTLDTLDTYSTVAEYVDAGYCATCAAEVYNAGFDTWPVENNFCLYEYWKSFETAGQAYDFWLSLWNGYEAGTIPYLEMQMYLSCHNSHVVNESIDPVICYDDCAANNSYEPVVPGPTHTNDDSFVCPWYSATTYIPVTSSADVSTPEALVALDSTQITLQASDAAEYIWQTGTLNAETGAITWTSLGDAAANCTITVSSTVLTTAYRCVAVAEDGTITAASDPFYLGGEAFFTWATTAEGVSEWLTDSATYAHVTVEYAVVAYEKYIGGIALSEVIHLITVTVDTTSTTYLIELYGGTTLATMDANNQLIDERYHIAVAQVDENGNILPLEITTATTTE